MGKVVIRMGELDNVPPKAAARPPFKWPMLPPRKQLEDKQAGQKARPPKAMQEARPLPVFSCR
jgi:hypothetical protein